MFITGATGTGKSHLARALFLTAAPPRLIIDPADSDLTRVPGAKRFQDPHRLGEAPTQRFVPADPYDLDVYDALYRRVFASGPRFVWVDEAGIALPVRGGPKGARIVLVQGRKRSIGHLACHTRPREVDTNVIAQAQFLAVFDLPNPDDRRRVAELAGIRPAELDRLMSTLPEFGFLWWSQRDRRLTACDPLPRS